MLKLQQDRVDEGRIAGTVPACWARLGHSKRKCNIPSLLYLEAVRVPSVSLVLGAHIVLGGGHSYALSR
jgi:hypothetical protein